VQRALHNGSQPGRYLGYLVNNGTYDSNPCGGTCQLNPVYEILPRNEWIARSGVCQRAEDFQFDPISQTDCCPSPDYCCPNSVADCTSPKATLFDASMARGGGIPTAALQGWRRHYLSRLLDARRAKPAAKIASNLSDVVCEISRWPYASGLTVAEEASCAGFAMTPRTVALVREAWDLDPGWWNRTHYPSDDDRSTMFSNGAHALEAVPEELISNPGGVHTPHTRTRLTTVQHRVPVRP
jgi:hypothetical protein